MAYKDDSGVIVQTKRVQIEDIDGIRQVFQMAYLTQEPSERSQRQTVKALLPEIYMLRDKGYSFKDIATFMNSSIKNFQLQPSTVRIYFTEMLVGRVDVCVARLKDQMIVLSDVGKINKGSEISMIAAKAAAIMERQRSISSKKVDAVYGLQDETIIKGSVDQIVAAATPLKKITAAQSAAPPAPIGADFVGSGYGLVASVGQETPSSEFVPSPANAFFDAPDDIDVVVDVIESSLPTEIQTQITCLPLRDGVKPLAKRPDLGEEFYSDAMLEHSAIPGLWLSLDARIYGALLEMEEDGKVRLESVQEKSFRIRWAKPIPKTPSSTSGNFVKMDLSLFKK